MRNPEEVNRIAADPAYIERVRAQEIDTEALRVARRRLEDIVIDFRDRGISTLSGNGLVARSVDGRDSSTIRLSTADALEIGVKAYLAAMEQSQ